jgi:hypothetical protein
VLGWWRLAPGEGGEWNRSWQLPLYASLGEGGHATTGCGAGCRPTGYGVPFDGGRPRLADSHGTGQLARLKSSRPYSAVGSARA